MGKIPARQRNVHPRKQLNMEKIEKYSKNYKVHVYETGPNAKATIASLFDYMQDVASDHAEIIGFGRNDMLKNKQFWVLSRMYAEIEELPEWRDEIIVTTWPSGLDKIFLTRNFCLTRPDGRPIANATSSWLVVDSDTRRLLRSDHITNFEKLAFQERTSPIRLADKLEWDPANFEVKSRFFIGLNDLDVNLHTNNVNYLKWVSNTYDMEYARKMRPKSVEINYLAESMFGNKVEVRNGKDDDSAILHSVFKTDENREICRVRIVWTDDNN